MHQAISQGFLGCVYLTQSAISERKAARDAEAIGQRERAYMLNRERLYNLNVLPDTDHTPAGKLRNADN